MYTKLDPDGIAIPLPPYLYNVETFISVLLQKNVYMNWLKKIYKWSVGRLIQKVLIFQILLFIKKTIKPSIFNLELQRRPVAANHLISYLKAHYDFKELEDLLGYNIDTNFLHWLKQWLSLIEYLYILTPFSWLRQLYIKHTQWYCFYVEIINHKNNNINILICRRKKIVQYHGNLIKVLG
jgi:hypothetical protein